MKITRELVRELFDYRDGLLYWKVMTCKNGIKKVGDVAGFTEASKGNRRRMHISPFGKFYHYKIVFLWHHGYIPEFIDHRDRNPANDKIENLRDVTRTENNRNVTSHKDSTSKYVGVHFITRKQKWHAGICVDGKAISLGNHFIEIDAAKAYNEAAVLYFGEFANLNIIE